MYEKKKSKIRINQTLCEVPMVFGNMTKQLLFLKIQQHLILIYWQAEAIHSTNSLQQDRL